MVGLGLLVWQLLPAWQKLSNRARSSALLTGLLALPFTVVWFYGYSYHFRLDVDGDTYLRRDGRRAHRWLAAARDGRE